MLPIAPALLIAGIVQLSCQFFKFIYFSIKEKQLSPKYLVTAGGMPSSHSAFAASISTSAAIIAGLDSITFAVAFVFSAIVMYDAYRLRGAVQKQAIRINKLSELAGLKDEAKLNEMLGHSLLEIAIGFLLGLTVTIICYMIWPGLI